MFDKSYSSEQCTLNLAGKRVIIVLPTLEMGGSERQALLLARYLIQDQKADVQVWGLNYPGRAVELCDEYALPWRIVPITWSYDRVMRFKAWARFTLALRQAQPDIILPYTMRPNVICGLPWRLTGAKICIWNQRDEGRSNRVGMHFQRLAVGQVPLFISNSEHGKRFLIEKLGVQQNRIHVIRNGVELPKPKSERATWRRNFGVSNDHFLACMVANLHSYKDHLTLLKAWKRVVDSLQEDNKLATLLLAGRFGDTYKQLQRTARELALEQSLLFLGQLDNIADLLNAVDLGVISSQHEGCPNAVLEYMAAGLPVTGTDIQGIREALGPDGFSFLAPPGDDIALADRILRLEENRDLRVRLGAINRARIDNGFSVQEMCNQTVRLMSRYVHTV